MSFLLGVYLCGMEHLLTGQPSILTNATKFAPISMIARLKFTSQNISVSVPRYKKVKITGLDENGQEVEWVTGGWGARVAQHEFDHLQVGMIAFL